MIRGDIYRNPKIYNPPEDKTTKKSNWTKYLLIILFLIIITIVIIYFLFISNYFKIRIINIEGSTLTNNLDWIKGQNILLFNSKSTIEKIKNENPEIERIKIVRGLPATIKINATKYEPQMVWKSQGKSYLVNQNGFVYSETESQNELPVVKDKSNILIELHKYIVTKNFVNVIHNITILVPEKTKMSIVSFEINDTTFQVNALTDRGWLVKFDTTRSIDDQVGALAKVIEEKESEIHEYIDVRVEGKVFYK